MLGRARGGSELKLSVRAEIKQRIEKSNYPGRILAARCTFSVRGGLRPAQNLKL
jgi:hypothetical protein